MKNATKGTVLKALLNNFLFNVTPQDFICVSKYRTALKGSSVTAVYCACYSYFRSAFKTTELIYLIKLLCGLCRYELPGINAFNFVLEDALGGGGVTSLRSDPQVKWKGFFMVFCFCFFSEKDFLSDWGPCPPKQLCDSRWTKKKKLVTAMVAKENFNLYLSYSHALCDILFFFFVNS